MGANEQLTDHRVFEQLLFDLSTQFVVVRLGADELAVALQDALERTNGWLATAGSAIGRVRLDPRSAEIVFRAGEALDLLATLPADLPECFERILVGEEVRAPGENARLDLAVQSASFSGLLLLPLSSEGRVITFLACWWRDTPCLGSEQVAQLRMVGELMLAALQRHESEVRQLDLEDKLQQGRKLQSVGLLAGGVAHDFNNVLTVIQSYAEMGLEHTSPKNDFLWEAFSEILAAAEHATALTSKLLAFGRQQLADRRAIDANETLLSLGRLLSRLLRANVDVEFDLGGENCVVSAAPIELEQIVMNLSINAGDAMPDGGRLTIRTRSLPRADRDTGVEAPFVCLSVIDTGSGIDKDHMPRIFDPFYTTKAVGEGSGLGLSVVHGIVTQLGGEIVVETERDRGTEFHIYLPQVEARAQSHSQSMVGRLTRGTETILLADDQERICALLGRMLEAEGYRTLRVGDGEQAIQMFDQHRNEIDLAVLDVVMPKLGGRQVCDHIAKHRPDLPVLFISGYTADALPQSYLDHPLRDLLLKPYPARTLLAAVRNMLDRANRHVTASLG